MAAKEVEFSVDARDRMLRDIDILASAMRMTFGPKGRNVVLEKSFGAPRIIKDGVTVAKEIELEDKFENMGVQIVRRWSRTPPIKRATVPPRRRFSLMRPRRRRTGSGCYSPAAQNRPNVYLRLLAGA
jgi:hypothetical protein